MDGAACAFVETSHFPSGASGGTSKPYPVVVSLNDVYSVQTSPDWNNYKSVSPLAYKVIISRPHNCCDVLVYPTYELMLASYKEILDLFKTYLREEGK